MTPVTKYTTKDVEELKTALEVLYAAGRLPKQFLMQKSYSTAFSDKITIKDTCIYHSDLDAGVEILHAETQPAEFLRVWLKVVEQEGLGQKIAWDMYSFVFHVPFESVPMYMEDESLCFLGLVKWRLAIGK